MGREKSADEYSGSKYMAEGTFDMYLPLYETAAGYLPAPAECNTIVDLGSGVGHFARVLFDRGYIRYIGIDFAPVMIEKARKQLPEATFILGDLRSEKVHKLVQNYDTFVILETLEHIERDLSIVESLPNNSLVILSAPDYDDPGHVRYFRDEQQIINRYRMSLKFLNSRTVCTSMGRIFIFRSKKI